VAWGWGGGVGLCRRMTWWTRPAATRPEHAYGAVSRRSCRWRPPPDYGARACRARLLCRACRARLRPSRVMRRSARLARYGPRLASGRPPQSSPCGSGDSDGPGPRPAGSVIAAMPPVSARAQPQPRTVPPRRVPCSGRRRSAPRGPRPLVSSKGSKYGPGLASLDPGNNGEMVVIAKIHHSVLVPTHPPSPPPSTGLAKLGAGLLLQPALAGRRLPRRA
jgi:hypothetical protein